MKFISSSCFVWRPSALALFLIAFLSSTRRAPKREREPAA